MAAKTIERSGHRVSWEKDYAKAFRSRPGSADWQVKCSCGWVYSSHAYGPSHAAEVAERHLRSNHV